MAKPIALSFSRLSTYETCPLKFYSQYISKDYPDEGDNYFFKKGKRKHGQLDLYTKSQLNAMINVIQYDEDVESCLPMIDTIIASYDRVASELQLAVDGEFVPTGWFGKKVMYRAIVDLEAVKEKEAMVIDWKTGKFREYDEKPTGQLHLTAAIEFARNPNIEKVTTVYVFIEHKQTIRRTFLREDYEELVEPFYEAWKQVNSEKDWKPKHNKYCGNCLLTPKQCPYK
jgi:CRISPR/Cas system-associated exonuclease Cas4 (RecB family)